MKDSNGIVEKKKRAMDIPKDPGPPTQEMVIVHFPEMTISPRSYNSYRVGNIGFETYIRENETPEEAYDRAWAFVEKKVREQAAAVSKMFNEIYAARNNEL